MAQLPRDGSQFGRYRIGRLLGRGAMGFVHAAVDEQLGREVAIKFLAQELAASDSYRNRFNREAAALATLESPHVITVYDAGELDGWLYIATQLVPDGDLNSLLKHSGPLSPDDAVDVTRQVARGVADAHEAGLLHRDIKPSNVVLRRGGSGWRAYVCDLGISQVVDAEHTRTTGVIGTLGYMAPERHEGAEATVASDVYAVGCLLWACLTGAPPYGGTDFHVALAHINEPIPQLDQDDARSDVLNAILNRAMAKAPAERYETMPELIDGLTAAAALVAPSLHDEAGATVVRQPVTVTEPLPDAGRTPVANGAVGSSAMSEEATSTNARVAASSEEVLPTVITSRTTPVASPGGRRRRAGLVLGGVAILLAGAVATAFALTAAGEPDAPQGPSGDPTSASDVRGAVRNVTYLNLDGKVRIKFEAPASTTPPTKYRVVVGKKTVTTRQTAVEIPLPNSGGPFTATITPIYAAGAGAAVKVPGLNPWAVPAPTLTATPQTGAVTFGASTKSVKGWVVGAVWYSAKGRPASQQNATWVVPGTAGAEVCAFARTKATQSGSEVRWSKYVKKCGRVEDETEGPASENEPQQPGGNTSSSSPKPRLSASITQRNCRYDDNFSDTVCDYVVRVSGTPNVRFTAFDDGAFAEASGTTGHGGSGQVVLRGVLVGNPRWVTVSFASDLDKEIASRSFNGP